MLLLKALESSRSLIVLCFFLQTHLSIGPFFLVFFGFFLSVNPNQSKINVNFIPSKFFFALVLQKKIVFFLLLLLFALVVCSC
jgi:hypothetical protein